MDTVFSFFFKYRPLVFQEGDVVFRGGVPLLLVLSVVGVGAAAALVGYLRPRGKAEPNHRMIMAFLRMGALGILLLALLRPTLVNSSTVPQRNFVGVLLDDSRSMTLPGGTGDQRSAFVEEAFAAEEGAILPALEEKFAVRLFRFSSSTDRIAGIGEMDYAGTRTNLLGAVDQVREELASVPLSGLIVVSDGADNSGLSLSETLVPLQAASVPVYTVGLGEEGLSPDIQIGRITAPRSVLLGTSLVLDVVVSHRGFNGQTLPLIIEDDQRILTEESVVLGPGDEPTVARVRFTLDRPGPRPLRFRIPVQTGEQVAENNERRLEIDVEEAREKILYFEGEPRYEVKFLRQSLAEDENLQLVVLQRTAEDKFLRLDVDDGQELAGGFPRTREELFQYSGLILGSVEASYFTHDQLSMIADFVNRRGGGFLMLGGRWAFAEGGYAGTPVAEALPVILESSGGDARTQFAEVRVRPTLAGSGHVATQIGQVDGGGWDSLPPLSTMNRITEIKPGATTLLAGSGSDGDRVVLAYQRYGRGLSVALPVVDSWMWQFHADIPLEDQTHETFWRQLLRWVVDGVPDYVAARADIERPEVGGAVQILVEVNDSAFLEVNDALVEATITGPDGTIETRFLDWTVERDGEYAVIFQPKMEGDYAVDVRAERRTGELLGTDRMHFSAGPSLEEYFDASLRKGFLQRLSEETGGRFYTPEEAGSLAEDISITGAGVTLTEERDLWDMPVLLLLFVSFLAGEWILRRRKGLA